MIRNIFGTKFLTQLLSLYIFSYVILENLRYMLMPYKPSDPIYFGCRFKPYVKQGYMSGGAGYVLSKEAVRRFVEVKYLLKYYLKTT